MKIEDMIPQLKTETLHEILKSEYVGEKVFKLALKELKKRGTI